MWADALAAHEAGRVRVTEARAADFVGPQVPAGPVAPDAPARRRCARAGAPGSIGDPDAPRSWAYLPDVAATLATLGTDERALGRAWHVPSDRAALAARRRSPTSPRRWTRRRRRVSGIPWPVLRAVGARRPDDARGRRPCGTSSTRSSSSTRRATTATFGLAADPVGRGRGRDRRRAYR